MSFQKKMLHNFYFIFPNFLPQMCTYARTYIHTYIPTDKQADIHTYIHTDRQTDRQTCIRITQGEGLSISCHCLHIRPQLLSTQGTVQTNTISTYCISDQHCILYTHTSTNTHTHANTNQLLYAYYEQSSAIHTPNINFNPDGPNYNGTSDKGHSDSERGQTSQQRTSRMYTHSIENHL